MQKITAVLAALVLSSIGQAQSLDGAEGASARLAALPAGSGTPAIFSLALPQDMQFRSGSAKPFEVRRALHQQDRREGGTRKMLASETREVSAALFEQLSSHNQTRTWSF